MTQYQWSQANLTAGVGTAIEPSTTGTGLTPVDPGTGESPNDGYGIQGQGQAQVVSILQQAAQTFGTDAT
jgi:mannan endo-1,4-beta-mannosidase